MVGNDKNISLGAVAVLPASADVAGLDAAVENCAVLRADRTSGLVVVDVARLGLDRVTVAVAPPIPAEPVPGFSFQAAATYAVHDGKVRGVTVPPQRAILVELRN